MAKGLPGGNTGYIPSHEATQGLVVDFIRNPKSFPLLNYCKYVPQGKMVGAYAEFAVEDRLRITDANNGSGRWADGADAPTGSAFGEKFEWLYNECVRYAEADRVGQLFAEQAAWDAVDHTSRLLAQLMMTKLASRLATLIQTTGNWPTGHTATVASLVPSGDTWENSTTARSDIKRCFDIAIEQVILSTGGAVTENDLMIVFPRKCARKVSVSQEIRDYIKGSPEAIEYLMGEEGKKWQKRAHGLPKVLYGLEVEVEDTVKVTTKRGQSVTRDYVFADTKPFICAKPGALEAPTGGPDFSTISIFGYNGSEDGKDDPQQDMLVETKYDEDNKRTNVRVIQNTDEVITAGVSGYLFQSAVA